MAKITGMHTSGSPAGTILPCGNATVLPRTLLCDGSAVLRTDYPELFAAIGTTYGAGNGSTTFNVPDLRGVFPRGAGTQNRYTFNIVAANATAGAVYSNNGQTFTVMSTISGSTIIVTNGSGTPLASGTLTKVSGTGDATISFSSQVSVSYSTTRGAVQEDLFKSHTHSMTRKVKWGQGNAAPRGFAGQDGNAEDATFTTDADTGGNIKTETRPANIGVNYCIAY